MSHQHYGVECGVPWCGVPNGRKSPTWKGERRLWTEQEDEHLLASDGTTVDTLADELDRTRSAITMRRYRLRTWESLNVKPRRPK
jgi:hypothetical protein